jgi:hypothetical protein
MQNLSRPRYVSPLFLSSKSDMFMLVNDAYCSHSCAIVLSLDKLRELTLNSEMWDQHITITLGATKVPLPLVTLNRGSISFLGLSPGDYKSSAMCKVKS